MHPTLTAYCMCSSVQHSHPRVLHALAILCYGVREFLGSRKRPAGLPHRNTKSSITVSGPRTQDFLMGEHRQLDYAVTNDSTAILVSRRCCTRPVYISGELLPAAEPLHTRHGILCR